MVHGGGAVACTGRQRRRGCGAAKHEGVWVKNPKPSRRGSVSGAPCGTGTGDVAWGWHGGAYEVMVVGGAVRSRNAGRGRWLGRNSKPSHYGSV